MVNVRSLVLALAAIPLLFTAACGDDEGRTSDAAEEAAPTPAVEADARYASVEKLRDAAVLAGMTCSTWDQSNKMTLAAESGTCGDDAVLSTYASQADLDAQVEQERANAALFVDAGVENDPVLVGPNWILNAPDVAGLAEQMGGTVLS